MSDRCGSPGFGIYGPVGNSSHDDRSRNHGVMKTARMAQPKKVHATDCHQVIKVVAAVARLGHCCYHCIASVFRHSFVLRKYER